MVEAVVVVEAAVVVESVVVVVELVVAVPFELEIVTSLCSGLLTVPGLGA